jgi:hypothetical protein
MSVDTTFKPLSSTFLIGVTATQVINSGAVTAGANTMRIQNILTTRQYLTWGPSSTVTAAGAPAAGAPVPNTIGLAGGESIYLEIPPTSYLIANIAAAFEVTAGTGGVGG